MITKKLFILLFALGLVSCASSQLPPLDDAYYWEETSVVSSPAATNESQSQLTPTIEYLNVQDTTVTIRIKK